MRRKSKSVCDEGENPSILVREGIVTIYPNNPLLFLLSLGTRHYRLISLPLHYFPPRCYYRYYCHYLYYNYYKFYSLSPPLTIISLPKFFPVIISVYNIFVPINSGTFSRHVYHQLLHLLKYLQYHLHILNLQDNFITGVHGA